MIKQAIIVEENGKYLVKTEDGSRTLGTHDTKKDAYIQLYAIHKSQEREKKKESSKSWSERYAIANQDEFDKAMGGDSSSMHQEFMDHYNKLFNNHDSAIKDITKSIIKTQNPDMKDFLRGSVGKHTKCMGLIHDIFDAHEFGDDPGDIEDQYHKVAEDAWNHSPANLRHKS